MGKKIGISSYIIANIYIISSSGVVGPKEKDGPLGKYFDYSYDKLLVNSKSFEKSEIELHKKAIDIAINKANINIDKIDIGYCGDLTNQIAVSSYMMRNISIPYIGIFAACSTLTLGLINAAFFLSSFGNYALVSTSSHNCTAERQFRYPNEYGAQRANTFTTTVTGAGAFVLANEIYDNYLNNNKVKLKITKVTVGKVVDGGINDSQDMGRAMAPACYHTIKTHLADFNMNVDDYDKIITGDLSFYGSKLLIDLFMLDNIDIRNVHEDTGMLIYDRNKQTVLSGGSGPGCIAAVLGGYIIKKMLNLEYNKILLCATGALMNTTILSQKETIPGICHAVTIETVQNKIGDEEN